MRAATLLRAGEVTEIVGRLSSGRTSLLVAALARATRAGAAAALVDVDDAFDPAGAARAGVELARLLWVRCARRRDVALRAADVLVRCPGFAVVALDLGELAPRLPLTASFRLRLAVRRSRVALVVLASRRIAGAGAALAVETVQTGIDWTGAARTATRLARLRSRVRVLRARGGSDWAEWGAIAEPSHLDARTASDGGEWGAIAEPSHPDARTASDGGEWGAISGPSHLQRRAISGPSHLEWWCA